MDRSPASSSLPTQAPLAPVSIGPSVCHICNNTMTEGQDCLILNECSHAFHRSCIENYLATSSQCAICQRACELNELRKLIIEQPSAPMNKPPPKTKARGAMAKHYNTRSVVRNVFQDTRNPLLDISGCSQGVPPSTPIRNVPNLTGNCVVSPIPSTTNAPTASSIDYHEMNRIVQENLSRFFQNFNLMPSSNGNNNNNQHQALPHNNIGSNANFPNNVRTNVHIPNMSPNSLYNSQIGNMPTDKITSIIQHWNLKFDGSSTGLNVEEFLYRLTALTRDNFQGDFSVICKHMQLLLTGNALRWFWRYHRQVQSIQWDHFCDAMRCQYKEFKSSFDIREELRNRKQKPNESFDNFFDSALAITDRLPTPMSDAELVEIIARNLRPEIRQDLLYVPIHSFQHLRKLVQMRENFHNEEHVRKNIGVRNPNTNFAPRRNVAEIDIEEEYTLDSETTHAVDAFQKNEFNSKCWNCDSTGHHWQDCLEERTIFCYGCGDKNVYKPNCSKCLSRKQNASKNLKPMGRQGDHA